MNQAFASLSGYIEQQHRWLDDLLLSHQKALVEKRLDAAKSFYECFHRALQVHAQAEDRILLDLHSQHCASPRWNTQVYFHEHRKIYDLLDKIGERVAALTEITTLDVIELLDMEKTLKGVLEHHGEREEQGLMSELQDCLSEQHSLELIDQLNDYWRDTNRLVQQTVAGLQYGLI